MKHAKLKSALSLSFCAVAMTGCAGLFNVGDTQFSCPGQQQGIVCKSVGEVYSMTEGQNPDVAAQVIASRGGTTTGGSGTVISAKSQNPSIISPSPIKAAVSAQSGPQPVLEPAQVARIWIAPWIDDKQDLNWPSYVFIETTPKRWSFGGKPISKQFVNVVPSDEMVLDPAAKKANQANQANQANSGQPAADDLPPLRN